MACDRGMNLEVRIEVFNAFNRVNFGVPNLNIASGAFGRIGSTATEAREMQFGVKCTSESVVMARAHDAERAARRAVSSLLLIVPLLLTAQQTGAAERLDPEGGSEGRSVTSSRTT